MDELMELERVRDVARREAEEERKRGQRVRDREVIMVQIKEAEQRKVIEEEAREQEGLVRTSTRGGQAGRQGVCVLTRARLGGGGGGGQAMVALMRKYEEEDRRLQAKKAEEIARMKLEIVAANEKAIHARKAVKEKEKEVGAGHHTHSHQQAASQAANQPPSA